MELKYYKDYKTMSVACGTLLIERLRSRPLQHWCVATGNSPTGSYSQLAKVFKEHPHYFEQLHIIKLDEWGGLGLTHPSSCSQYIKTHLLGPLEIGPERYIDFGGKDVLEREECHRMQTLLKNGPELDLCILGLGQNGHLGFNEPGSHLRPNFHSVTLSPTSMGHAMVGYMERPPKFGLTLGMADILSAKEIVLLISGPGKSEIIQRFLSKEISTALPASFLWLHQNVHCFINSECL